jgi:hypothetical protein
MATKRTVYLIAAPELPRGGRDFSRKLAGHL